MLELLSASSPCSFSLPTWAVSDALQVSNIFWGGAGQNAWGRRSSEKPGLATQHGEGFLQPNQDYSAAASTVPSWYPANSSLAGPGSCPPRKEEANLETSFSHSPAFPLGSAQIFITKPSAFFFFFLNLTCLPYFQLIVLTFLIIH